MIGVAGSRGAAASATAAEVPRPRDDRGSYRCGPAPSANYTRAEVRLNAALSMLRARYWAHTALARKPGKAGSKHCTQAARGPVRPLMERLHDPAVVVLPELEQ